MGKKKLLIVESPAKAKTIKKYLGKGFEVAASYGHIRDLPRKNMAVDIENDFTPTYEIPKEKKEVVKQLKKMTRETDEVLLATDEDREGEAIAWHVAQILGLPVHSTKRIVFNEITKKAIQGAVKNPRTIDLNLVNAQQARRILDRIVGYELSPLLWKKVKQGLSAGRVQSVAVRLIVEREREIISFKAKKSFKITGLFENKTKNHFSAKLEKDLQTYEETREIFSLFPQASFVVEDIEKKKGKKTPPPPFITSTLQQEASRVLGFSVAQTMRLAQTLYEAGYITYMRTDSVTLSDFAHQEIQKLVIEKYGKEYYQKHKFKQRSRLAQEAHEAIRPTNFSILQPEINDTRAQKLYTLIWKRAVASQMADAKVDKTTIKIRYSEKHPLFIAKGEVITFPGFLKLYSPVNEEDEKNDNNILPDVKQGEVLQLLEAQAKEHFTKHPPRYNEAALVRELEKRGIGRPSTYAPTISTIQQRGYIEKKNLEPKERKIKVLTYTPQKGLSEKETKEKYGTEKNKLFPTDLAFVVTDFLKEHFPDIVDYNFTATVEEEFDRIAQGKKQWIQLLKEFYGKFHPIIEKTEKYAQRASGERVLGTDPKTGKPIIVRIARYGPVVQLGDSEDPDKKYFKLPSFLNLETITLKEAILLLQFPKKLGEFEGKDIVLKIGRYGPYLEHDGKNYSIPKKENILHLRDKQAVDIILEKREKQKNLVIHNFEDLQVLNGRYGPYIKYKGRNYALPKKHKANPEKLTREECLKIIEEAKNKKKKKKNA